MLGTYYSTSGQDVRMTPLKLPDCWVEAVAIACKEIDGEVLIRNTRAGFVLVAKDDKRVLITRE